MASVASEIIEEVTAYAERDSLEDGREICADGTYFRITYAICSISLGVVHFRSLLLVKFIKICSIKLV